MPINYTLRFKHEKAILYLELNHAICVQKKKIALAVFSITRSKLVQSFR